MRPGDTISLLLYRQTAAGAAVPGMVLADFDLTTYLNGVVTAMTPAITEIAATTDGLATAYKLSLTLPGTLGMIAVRAMPATGTDLVYPDHEFEVETYDIDSIHDLVVQPTVGSTATSVPDVDTTLVFDAYRYHEVTISKVDAAGDPVPLNGYNNGRFNVWTRDHSGTIYTVATTGMTVGGIITITVPEDAAFFSNIAAAIALGQDSITLYWEVVADKAATAAKSQNLARGTLTLRRFEGPAV